MTYHDVMKEKACPNAGACAPLHTSPQTYRSMCSGTVRIR